MNCNEKVLEKSVFEYTTLIDNSIIIVYFEYTIIYAIITEISEVYFFSIITNCGYYFYLNTQRSILYNLILIYFNLNSQHSQISFSRISSLIFLPSFTYRIIKILLIYSIIPRHKNNKFM